MNTYHILYKFDSSSKGENFKALTPIQAYAKFREEHGADVFIGMYCLEALESLHFNIEATQEAAEVDDIIRANKAEYQKSVEHNEDIETRLDYIDSNQINNNQ